MAENPRDSRQVVVVGETRIAFSREEKHSEFHFVNRTDMTDNVVKATLARHTWPAVALGASLVLSLFCMAGGVVWVCSMKLSDTATIAAVLSLAVGIGGPSALVLKKLVDKLLQGLP